MTSSFRTAILVAAFAISLGAQEVPPPIPPPDPQVPPAEEPAPPADPAPLPQEQLPPPSPEVTVGPESEGNVTPLEGEERQGGDIFPDTNIYLPEGELDIKVRKLIQNSLFEGQVNYNFVDGDISTFLRYKYYARDFAYKLGVFDELEFDQLGGATDEFNRVRGGLLMISFPKDYDTRYTLLTQVDSLAYGEITRPDNDKTNVYTKLGYQFGTEADERLNSIIGETRGRIIPVLTAYRDVGPRQMGLALAITSSIEGIGSDFEYLKLEGELLRRYDYDNQAVLLTRVHAGTFASKTRLIPEDDPTFEEYYKFSIPRYELFKLGGRDLLKGVDGNVRGTDEMHGTAEYFYPVFRNQDYRKLGARFTDLFAIAYSGAGVATYGLSDIVKTDRWVIDMGIGFELGLRVRNYDIVLSAIYATPLVKPDDVGGGELLVSARTSR